MTLYLFEEQEEGLPPRLCEILDYGLESDWRVMKLVDYSRLLSWASRVVADEIPTFPVFFLFEWIDMSVWAPSNLCFARVSIFVVSVWTIPTWCLLVCPLNVLCVSNVLIISAAFLSLAASRAVAVVVKLSLLLAYLLSFLCSPVILFLIFLESFPWLLLWAGWIGMSFSIFFYRRVWPIELVPSAHRAIFTVLLQVTEFILDDYTVAAFGISFKICSRNGFSGPLAVHVPK